MKRGLVSCQNYVDSICCASVLNIPMCLDLLLPPVPLCLCCILFYALLTVCAGQVMGAAACTTGCSQHQMAEQELAVVAGARDSVGAAIDTCMQVHL